jgi:hypothetical protein
LSNIFHPIGVVPAVLIKFVPEGGQKIQASNTKLRQDVAVTVTQANREVMSDKRGHKKFHSDPRLMTSVTK